MYGKAVSGKMLILLLASAFILLLVQPVRTEAGGVATGNLKTSENDVLALVNGSEAYSYDLHLENIALSHLAFRVAGSAGATESADWIANQFESFGLEVAKEEFQFANWDLLAKPTLVIDDDGDLSSTGDQKTIDSFQSADYSLPTDMFGDLVVLPLPPAANLSEVGAIPIGTLWDDINTRDKIVLVGKEVRVSRSWELAYKDKLTMQPPKAVIYTWWYDWNSFKPDAPVGAGGRPVAPRGRTGPYYWDLNVSVGVVNYGDGLFILNRENDMNVSAKVVIPSVLGVGSHYNVVGKLNGHGEPEKLVVVLGHYDSGMCSGFLDNGAGTSGVIELARVFAMAVRAGLYYPKYTILFLATAAEEIYAPGLTNYVFRHKAEMEDIVAVINFDGIGHGDLFVTETKPASEFDLNELVLGAAADLGINASTVEGPLSEEDIFLNPSLNDDLYFKRWGLNASIGDVTPVVSASGLTSDLAGTVEWYHTLYDNSTTPNWVKVDDLERHIKVAALSIMRVSPMFLVVDLNNDGTVNILDITIVATAYGTKPGDEKWNALADLDKNRTVNILDISAVAKDYGKTV